MKYRYGKVALVVGASSGVGKECARYLLDEGYIVYGTSRKVSYADVSENEDASKVKMIPLDVTQEDTIIKAINYIAEKEGEIGIVINCPGYGLAGAIEETSLDDVKKIFETNFFGIMMVCRNILPIMRKKQKGLIVNISSVAGFITIPFQSMYSASKYALEAMTEALRMEVKEFGINVSLIEPGDMKTNFVRETVEHTSNDSVYKEKCDKAVNEMIKCEMKGPEPKVVVREFKKILNSKKPPIRKIVGLDYKVVGLLKKLCPSNFVEYIVTKIYL